MKKLLTLFLLFTALQGNAQNIWRAASVFEQWVNFNALATQKSGTDTLFIRTIGANTTLNHGSGTLLLNNSKAAIGFFDASGYRIAAGSNNIQIQTGSTDSCLVTFVSDTMKFNSTVAAYQFTPKLDANSVTGFWKTDGNAGTNPATNFLGTTDVQPIIIASDNYGQAVFGNAVSSGASDTAVLMVGDTGLFTFTQLEIDGQLKIVDGTEGNGKILTSSIDGTASWQPASTAPLDSASIYALTPTLGTQYYCTDCTGNGITGRIVAYIAAAWKRLNFE